MKCRERCWKHRKGGSWVQTTFPVQTGLAGLWEPWALAKYREVRGCPSRKLRSMYLWDFHLSLFGRRQELPNRFIQELCILGIVPPSRPVSPQRRNGHQQHTGNKRGLVSCV